MTSNNTNVAHGDISPELDELSSTLMGDALDLLAEGEDMGVLVVVQDGDGSVSSYEFTDDGPAALLEGARACIRRSRHGLRYALTYIGAIEMDDGTYAEALILEFGERGQRSFSAYSLFEGRGEGDAFMWTDPAPAGEEEPLLG
ncbi:MAG: hypothetical protein Q4A07_12875 [Coriobacteriales bacterium]|nr:hypothetical protein [Coriobacteriales bacterium]